MPAGQSESSSSRRSNTLSAETDKSGPDVELPSLAVECELCESWEMEGDTTLVFRLRDDVRWQDVLPLDGRTLTSEDIVYSYNRQRQSGWPNASLLAAVDSMETPSPDALRISLAFPDADFMVSLADGHSKIAAREAVAINGDLKNGPTIGTGPWTLKTTQSNTAHIFESNPEYFEDGLPLVDGINR